MDESKPSSLPSPATAAVDPTRGAAAPASMPIAGELLYRPGARWAAIALLIPVLIAFVGVALAARHGFAHSTLLPGVVVLLLCWLLILSAFWLTLKRVRITAEGIEVARPWHRGHALRWGQIVRVRTRRGALLIEGQNGGRLSFRPFLLRDGNQLRRRLLLHVPSQVIRGPLRQEAQRLMLGPVYRATSGELAGALETRAALPWRVGALLVAFAALALAIALVLAHGATAPLAIALVVGLGLLAIVALWLWLWLTRGIFFAEDGIARAGLLPGRSRDYRWEEFLLVEVAPGELLLRFRGEPSLVCIGPRLLPARDRQLATLFIREYCERRGVARVNRRRFW